MEGKEKGKGKERESGSGKGKGRTSLGSFFNGRSGSKMSDMQVQMPMLTEGGDGAVVSGSEGGPSQVNGSAPSQVNGASSQVNGNAPSQANESSFPPMNGIPPPLIEVPQDPRDHIILEVIYTEMHAERFINLSPLSLLANALGSWFESEWPIFIYPIVLFYFGGELPFDAVVERKRFQLCGHKAVPSLMPFVSSLRLTVWIALLFILFLSRADVRTCCSLGRGVDVRTHPPIVFRFPPTRETPSFDVVSRNPNAPGSSTGLNDRNTGHTKRNPIISLDDLCNGASPYASLDVSTSTQIRTRLPNPALDVDLRSLNLHLALRVKEIVTCAEAMWDWVEEFQMNGRRRDGVYARILELTRAQFDELVLRFEL